MEDGYGSEVRVEWWI